MKAVKCLPRVVCAGFLLTNGCLVVREHPRGVVVAEAPPSPQVEVVPAAPGREYVWTEGYWVWHGRWVWEPGRWIIRPHSGAIWTRGQWVHRRHDWLWEPGHWH
ncbi:MAG TPA: hypothetical protein VN887_09310 [Candidatus Angelobacter sp.]|nr:hypothetical protein [Candidatus Angelobacter sp.]